MADPNVLHLAHYTVVVRDIRLAEAFYAKVMDADVVRRSWKPEEPDPVGDQRGRRFGFPATMVMFTFLDCAYATEASTIRLAIS